MWLKKTASWVVDRELWLVGMAVVPLVLSEHLPPVWPRTGLLLAALPWLFRLLTRGSMRVSTPLDLPILVLGVMLPVGLYVSVDRLTSRITLYQVLAGIATYYAIVHWAHSAKQTTWIALGLTGLGVSLALTSLVATRWSTGKVPSLAPAYEYLRPRLSDPGDPNVLAGGLGMIIPIPVSLASSSLRSLLQVNRQSRAIVATKLLVRVVRSLLALSALAMLLVLALYQSRGAWIGVAIGLLVLGVLYNRQALFLLPLAAVGALLALQQGGLAWLMEAPLTVNALHTLEGRQEVWSRAIYAIQDFPYTGIGLRAFVKVIPILYPYFLLAGTYPTQAHNLILQVAIDLGLPGLVAFTALFTGSMAASWRAQRVFAARGQRDLQMLAAGLLASLVVMGVHGLIDAVTWGSTPSVIPWSVMGLSVALWQLAQVSPIGRTRCN